MKRTESERLFRQARRYIPGGVNSPVRSFRSVGGTPPFIVRGRGAHLYSADGERFIDYVNSWGAMILGHAHPAVVRAARQAAALGTSFGAPTPGEVELAQLLTRLVPSMQEVRLVNSGTEATMSAIRLARAVTRRDVIVKFGGAYHGHVDSLLVEAGSGAATHGVPFSAGVPQAMSNLTLLAPYNDLDAVDRLFQRHAERIAAVLVEPVAGNMGVVRPRPGFLEGLRTRCRRAGSLLIFDEVMTGFRVAMGGAQAKYGVEPDLTCLGKIIGGGLPIGAYGGRRELMEQVAPVGPVYQAGTLSGNPLAVAVGLATLRELMKLRPHRELERHAERLCRELVAAARREGVPCVGTFVGAMFSIFMTDQEPANIQQVQRSHVACFQQFFHLMLDQGIYLAPSPFEANFLSIAHTPLTFDRTIHAAKRAFAKIARGPAS